MAKKDKIEFGKCLCTPQKESRRRPSFGPCTVEGCNHVAVAQTSEALLDAVNDHEAYHAVRSAYVSVMS